MAECPICHKHFALFNALGAGRWRCPACRNSLTTSGWRFIVPVVVGLVAAGLSTFFIGKAWFLFVFLAVDFGLKVVLFRFEPGAEIQSLLDWKEIPQDSSDTDGDIHD